MYILVECDYNYYKFQKNVFISNTIEGCLDCGKIIYKEEE